MDYVRTDYARTVLLDRAGSTVHLLYTDGERTAGMRMCRASSNGRDTVVYWDRLTVRDIAALIGALAATQLRMLLPGNPANATTEKSKP